MTSDNFLLNMAKTSPILIATSLITLQESHSNFKSDIIEQISADLTSIIEFIRNKKYLIARTMICSIKNQIIEIRHLIAQSEQNMLIFDNILLHLSFLSDELYYIQSDMKNNENTIHKKINQKTEII